MPLLFDALNIFTRKSRLASCAVSLASASAAPNTPLESSTNGPAALEVISAPQEPEVYTVHVEVGAGSGGGTVLKTMESGTRPGHTRKTLQSPRRPTARHALLKCTVNPSTSKQSSLRRSSASMIPDPRSSGHRRKRSSSSSSIAESESLSVAFPTLVEEVEGAPQMSIGNGEASVPSSVREDVRPPRKRARRSAVSITQPDSTSTSTDPSRCQQDQSPSHSLQFDESTSTSPSQLSPMTTSHPQPPQFFSRQQRDLASMYHTLLMHHEFAIPDALDEQASLGVQRKWTSRFDPSTLEELHDQDWILLTRIYLRLLLSRVPVAPLQHDRLRRTKEWDDLEPYLDSAVLDSPRTVPELEEKGDRDRSEVDTPSPWLGVENGMDVDETRPKPEMTLPPDSTLPSDASPSSALPVSPDVPQWVGPPYPSLSNLIVDLTLRYRQRASIDSSRRKRARPSAGVSRSQTKSKLGLASVTWEDLVKEDARRRAEEGRRRAEELLNRIEMMDAEGMDMDGIFEATLSPAVGWCEADEEEATFGRNDPQPSKQLDATKSAGDVEAGDLDSDSDDDNEWRRLRTELVSGSVSDSTPSASLPIPIRPQSPVPHHLELDDVSPPAVRSLPVREATNTGSRTRKSSASSRSGRIRKTSTSSRKPLPKIKYPEHALAVAR